MQMNPKEHYRSNSLKIEPDRNCQYDAFEPVVITENKEDSKMETGQLWRQYIIACIVNIGICCTGYSMGWTSPMHLTLGNITTSPLEHAITTEQEAWIGSLLSVGAIFGPFLGGFAASTIGRKWGLIGSCIPLLIGWILILLAANVTMIYVGRIFWGLGIGIIFTLSPMYCAEIATDDSRGTVGTLLLLFNTVGFLKIYSIGPFASYNVIAYVGIAFVAIFFVGVFFMPESPWYHLANDNKEAATDCLAKIRGRSHKAVKDEIDKMSAEITNSMQRSATIADIFRGSNFKAFYISCALLFFQQFSGINAVLYYSTTIFEASGADIDSSIATIIIGVVLVVASCVTPLVVDRLGRRTLLFISTIGSAISLMLLGVYFLLADNSIPVAASLSFLPVLALVMYIVTYCAGIGPLPWAIMAELFPIEVKTLASPIATAFCWILTFLITRFFSILAEAIGMGATFLMFGVCCVFAFFFTLFLVPETKGKSFQEIQDILAGKSSVSSDKI